LAALALLIDFPRQFVIEMFTLTFSLPVAGHVVTRLYREYRKSHPEQPKPAAEKEKQSMPTFSLTSVVIIGFLVFKLTTQHSQKPAWEGMKGAGEKYVSQRQLPQSSLYAIGTVTYWKTTVHPIFLLKFTPLDEDASAQVVTEEFANRLVTSMERAKAQSTQNVDSDLVRLVENHLKFDEAILSRIEAFKKDPAQQTPEKRDRRARQKLGEAFDSLLELQSESYDNLPENAQAFLELAAAIRSGHAEHYREIEIMQARLSERYPHQDFSLPNLEFPESIGAD
jgi:hypothetical protein